MLIFQHCGDNVNHAVKRERERGGGREREGMGERGKEGERVGGKLEMRERETLSLEELM